MLKTGFELPTAITSDDMGAHDTLIYNPKDEAGFNPTAVYYVREI